MANYNKNDLIDTFGDFSYDKLVKRWERAKKMLGAEKMLDCIVKSLDGIKCVEALEAIEKNFGYDV